MIVKGVIAHILHHVDAEAGDSDPSQKPGVQGRVQLVRAALQGLEADNRSMQLGDIVQEISDAIPNQAGRASFRRAIVNMQDDHRPQLAIQAWVGKNQEQRGG